MVGRGSGEVRYYVRVRADSATCLEVVRSFAAGWASILYTDSHNGYDPVGDELSVVHATVKHGSCEGQPREWARDDDGDGVRVVHCTTCEGAGAGLRTYLRGFRGVHKGYLATYVAAYETMTNAKVISAEILRRMCFGDPAAHAEYT